MLHYRWCLSLGYVRFRFGFVLLLFIFRFQFFFFCCCWSFLLLFHCFHYRLFVQFYWYIVSRATTDTLLWCTHFIVNMLNKALTLTDMILFSFSFFWIVHIAHYYIDCFSLTQQTIRILSQLTNDEKKKCINLHNNKYINTVIRKCVLGSLGILH